MYNATPRMQQFSDPIRHAIVRATGLAADDVKIEQPRDPSLGDLAFPCFALAKAQKKAPPAIAAELATQLSLPGITAKAAGPYINFRIDRAVLARTVLGEIEERGEAYGHSKLGAGKTVVVDLSSPNIAKPMSVGHLRSTVIGAAIQRLHDALGYRTVGINHIGDWGAQFGKLVAAVDRWGGTVDLESDPIKSLLALYVRYHEEEEQDPTLDAAARAAFQELESGVDGKVRATWRRLTELSLREFDKIYQRLGVRFDEVRGEAFYEPYLQATIERIVAAGVTEESQGALIVDLTSLDKNMPPCLLRKTDGTTLYATRDLAAVFHRHELYDFDRCLYVVGADQRLHFRQLKGVLKRMQLPWEPRVEHIDFGMMRLPEGKMSTRKGRVVFLEDVLDRAIEEARRIISDKNPALAGADRIAEQVGIGAVVFNDLKRERVKDVEFVWEEVLSFEGETGPYVQYTHARLASILRKAAESGEDRAPPDHAQLEEAGALLVRLAQFPDVIRSAAQHAEPSELSTYLLGLCREVNNWYVQNRVLGQDAGVTAARLALVRASKRVISNGLRLLGLAAPEEM
ncbi:MAG: arginine--tRNA ligase [Planctomycetota bacterium]